MNSKIKSLNTYIKLTFAAIKSSFVKSLKGEENYAKVFFGWGVFLYSISILISITLIPVAFSELLSSSIDTFDGFALYFIKFSIILILLLEFFIKGLIGLYLYLFLTLYPVIFSFLFFRSVVKKEVFIIIISAIGLVAFLFVHYLVVAKIILIISNILFLHLLILPKLIYFFITT